MGSGCKVSNTADGADSTGMANSPTRFKLSEVRKVMASRLEGSSVDEVISITAVVPGRPSSKNCESVFGCPRHVLNPKQQCGFDLLKLLSCNVGRASSYLPLHFGQK